MTSVSELHKITSVFLIYDTTPSQINLSNLKNLYIFLYDFKKNVLFYLGRRSTQV